MIKYIKNLISSFVSKSEMIDDVAPPIIANSPMSYHVGWDYELYKNDLSARVSYSYWVKDVADEKTALICSIDTNGFLREKSLRYLIKYYKFEYNNRILLRLCDWVEPIQTVADKWFSENVEKLSLEYLDSEIKVLFFVFRKESIKERPIYAQFAKVLKQKINDIEKREFYKLSLKFRKLIYEILQSQDMKISEFLKLERAPSLLTIPLEQNDVSKEYLDRLLKSNSSAVKSKLYDYYNRVNIRPPEEFLIDSLVASSYSIRARAKFYLSFSEEELVKHYSSISAPHKYYLADLRRKEDTEEFIIAFKEGGKMQRGILIDYFIDMIHKSATINERLFTQEILSQMYNGGSKLRHAAIKNFKYEIEYK